MAKNSNEILEEINEKRKKIRWPPGYGPESDLSDSIKKNIDNAIVRAFDLKHADAKIDRETVKQKVKSELSRGGLNELLAAAKSYQTLVSVHEDQHEQLKKIEHGQGLRNLIWRAATTFTIASIIFFFYWVASCLGISLPLSRLTL